MSDISEWSVKEEENTHLDELTLSGEGGRYTNKVMCAVKKKFNGVDARLDATGPYTFKGGLEDYEDLAEIVSPDVGDAYTIAALSGETYAYDGENWVSIGFSDSVLVHRSGAETLEGVKTFQNTASGHSTGETVTDLVVRNPEVDRGTPVEGGRSYTRVILADREGDIEETFVGRLGLLEVVSPKENDTIGEELRLGCYRYSDVSADYDKDALLKVGYDLDAIPFSTAPATSDDRTNSTDIVTRGYMEASEWNWQKTKKAGAVAFKPVPESDLEPIVDFLFSETPPAIGDKGPENPSTISGVSEVKTGRVGRNLLLKATPTYFPNPSPVTITQNADGTYTFNGTNNTSNVVYVSLTDSGYTLSGNKSSVVLDSTKNYTMSATLVSGTYTVSSTSSSYLFGYSSASGYYSGKDLPLNGGSYFTLMAKPDADGRFIARMSISPGSSFADAVFAFQLEEGSTATNFEAPILPAEANYTIQLGGTYYGGSLDVATGVMTVTWAGATISEFISFNDAYTNVIAVGAKVTFRHKGAVGPTGYCTSNRFLPIGGNGDVEHFRQAGPAVSGDFWLNFYIAKTRLDISDAADPSSPTSEEWLAAANAWIAEHPIFYVGQLFSPQIIQLTPTQIRSLPALDKYEPRINTVYADQEAVQVGYQRFFDENRLAAIEARLDALEGEGGSE